MHSWVFPTCSASCCSKNQSKIFVQKRARKADKKWKDEQRLQKRLRAMKARNEPQNIADENDADADDDESMDDVENQVQEMENDPDDDHDDEKEPEILDDLVSPKSNSGSDMLDDDGSEKSHDDNTVWMDDAEDSQNDDSTDTSTDDSLKEYLR